MVFSTPGMKLCQEETNIWEAATRPVFLSGVWPTDVLARGRVQGQMVVLTKYEVNVPGVSSSSLHSFVLILFWDGEGMEPIPADSG